MSFSLQEYANSDKCYNMNEPRRHYAKWNKPMIKAFVWLYDCT